MCREAFAGLIAVLLVVSPALAEPVIIVGDWMLEPDTADQSIQIHVSGGDAVDGVDFFLQVADGGPESGGSIDGPAITGVDIFTGTIFDGNNTGEAGGGQLVPQFWQSGTTTDSGTVIADGLLATATIDTTGFYSHDPITLWDLKLTGTLMGDSSLQSPPPGVSTRITNGSISVGSDVQPIPEPSTLVLLVIGALCLVGWRRRVDRHVRSAR
jgi:hypothetical protein